MEQAQKERTLIRELFEKFYTALEQAGIVTECDVYLRIDLSVGELFISTPDEGVLVREVIFSWIPSGKEPLEEIEARVLSRLRASLSVLREKGYFDRPIFQTPTHVLYVDDLGEVREELLLIDQEWMLSDDPLMKGLDEELAKFFEQLMREE